MDKQRRTVSTRRACFLQGFHAFLKPFVHDFVHDGSPGPLHTAIRSGDVVFHVHDGTAPCPRDLPRPSGTSLERYVNTVSHPACYDEE